MLFSVVGASIVATAICIILKKTNPEFSMVAALITGILIFALVLANLVPFFKTINQYVGYFGLNNVFISTVLKALGICYLTQLASETCKDAGYCSIASKVELCGKVAIIILSLPMFVSLIETIEKLVFLKWKAV